MSWVNDHRPGYFGRQRDQKVKALDEKFGKGLWRLAWVADISLPFDEACIRFYEKSYFYYLRERKEEVDFICSFGECIDNAPTNIQSGCDYTKQEAFSTHIQDIAIRNVLKGLGRSFEGSRSKILIIRSSDSNGFRFGPGNIPFINPEQITQPSLVPHWGKAGSVEDFWQSNKWVQVFKR